MDRFAFERRQLDNGLTLHTHFRDVEFAQVNMCIPVGSIHSVEPHRNGAFHFLEHVVGIRSELYPGWREYEKFVALNGGSTYAGTGSDSSTFNVRIPSRLFRDGLKGFLAQIFEPVISEADVRHESGAIINERMSKRRYWPAQEEIGGYLWRKWMNLETTSLDQVFGSISDLREMSSEDILKALECYQASKNIHILVGGNFELDFLCSELENISLGQDVLPDKKYQSIHWVNREFHEVEIGKDDRYVYLIGGILPSLSEETSFALDFIDRLLTNPWVGMLYRWLREEKDWAYSIGFSHSTYVDRLMWHLDIPLRDREHVEIVRSELRDKIVVTLKDEKIVRQAINQYKNSSVFWYENLDNLLKYGGTTITRFGRTYSQAGDFEMIDRFSDTTYLMEVFEKCFSPEVTGEILTLPK